MHPTFKDAPPFAQRSGPGICSLQQWSFLMFKVCKIIDYPPEVLRFRWIKPLQYSVNIGTGVHIPKSASPLYPRASMVFEIFASLHVYPNDRQNVDKTIGLDVGWHWNITTVLEDFWLVVSSYRSEKYESVGMMTFPVYGKIIQMFQTTNQICVTPTYLPAIDMMTFAS